MKNRIENWTPHTVTLVRDDQEDLAFPSVGQCRAVSQQMEPCVADTRLGPVITVPPPKHDAIAWSRPDGEAAQMGSPEDGAVDERPDTVIVSFVAAPLVAGRAEFRVWVPDTSPGSVVRDDAGQIVGVRRMVQYAPGRSGPIRANYVPDPSKQVPA